MNRKTLRPTRGVTLTELLVVLLIVGLLASAAVPAFVARQEDARRRVALGEAREIAHAEEMVAIQHGFYVPFQVLDDMPYRPGAFATNEERIDQIPYDVYVINPIIPSFVQLANQFSFQGLTTNPSGIQRIENMVRNWSGPYVNFQRFYVRPPLQFGETNYYSSLQQYRDYPLDPWGNPYRFYSAQGLIGSTATDRDYDFADTFSDGRITNDDPNRFDRYAVVSWGNDGIPDTGFITGTNGIVDDIIYLFGSDGVESNFGRIF